MGWLIAYLICVVVTGLAVYATKLDNPGDKLSYMGIFLVVIFTLFPILNLLFVFSLIECSILSKGKQF